MNHQTNTCKNCDAFVGNNYCAECGQRITVAKITVKETFREITNMFFSIDAPLMVTIKYIITNPGKLFREFITGKRKTYYKPVAFFILMTVVYVLIHSILKYDPLKDAEIQEAIGNTKSKVFKAGKFMQRNITNFLFFFVFSLGISLKLMFRKRYSIAEYLAVGFYLTGIYTFLISCMMYFMRMLPMNLKGLPFLVMMFYFLYAITSFFKSRSIKTFIKGILAYILAIFLYILCSFGLSILITSFSN